MKSSRDLSAESLYAFDKFTSLDVYDAVLNKGILNADDFIENYVNQLKQDGSLGLSFKAENEIEGYIFL